jgi:hypothetical protein
MQLKLCKSMALLKGAANPYGEYYDAIRGEAVVMILRKLTWQKNSATKFPALLLLTINTL